MEKVYVVLLDNGSRRAEVVGVFTTLGDARNYIKQSGSVRYYLSSEWGDDLARPASTSMQGTKKLGSTQEEFNALTKEFIETLDPDRDEFYISQQTFAKNILDDLAKFIWYEDIEKEKRYKHYLELKKEFENQ